MNAGENKSRVARALISNLARKVAERELKIVAEKLGWTPDCLHVESVPSIGPGNALVLQLGFENITETFTGFGERGVDWHSITIVNEQLSGSGTVTVNCPSGTIQPTASFSLPNDAFARFIYMGSGYWLRN